MALWVESLQKGIIMIVYHYCKAKEEGIMRKVVALFAKIASGKSTCAQYVKREYNFKVIEIGDYVRDAFRNESPSKNTLIEFANYHYKSGILTAFIRNAIYDSRAYTDNLVFSGLRTNEELDCLLSEYPDAILIRIDCAYRLRCQRFEKEKKDNVSFELRDAIENEWIQNEWNDISFDYTIINNKGLKDYYVKIDEVFSCIMKAG